MCIRAVAIIATASCLTTFSAVVSGAPVPGDDDPPAQQEAAQPSEPRGEPPGGFIWAEHPAFESPEFRIELHVKVQQDVRASYAGADVTAGLTPYELQRSRIGLQGEFLRHIEFEIERDFAQPPLTPEDVLAELSPKTPWKDVYVNVTYVKRAQVKAGRFKIPFGLDELTGITHIDFVYRSLGAEYLAPGRDTGVMVHGRFFKKALNYWIGAFEHDGDNARSKKIYGGNRTFSGRFTGTPFRAVKAARLDALELGAAFASTEVADDSFRANGLRGRTVVTEDTFFQPVYVNGERRRWEADVDWPLLRQGLFRAELTYVSDERHGQGYANQDLPAARYRAWYVSGTYIVTGEEKTRPIQPRRPFLQRGVGAIELAGRYERLYCDGVSGGDTAFRNPRAETIYPNGNSVLTLGVNWVLNRWVLLQANIIREQIEDAQRSPVPNGAPFWSRVLRLQLTL